MCPLPVITDLDTFDAFCQNLGVEDNDVTVIIGKNVKKYTLTQHTTEGSCAIFNYKLFIDITESGKVKYTMASGKTLKISAVERICWRDLFKKFLVFMNEAQAVEDVKWPEPKPDEPVGVAAKITAVGKTYEFYDDDEIDVSITHGERVFSLKTDGEELNANRVGGLAAVVIITSKHGTIAIAYEQ